MFVHPFSTGQEIGESVRHNGDHQCQTDCRPERKTPPHPIPEANYRPLPDPELHRTLSLAGREGSQFGLLAVDLDDFKPVNDRFGHPVGDALLQSVAQRLQTAVRAGDFCARVGGDEFAVIVHGVHNAGDMRAVSQKLCAELAQAHPFNASAPPSRASVGWALYPEDGNNAIDLMALADARMYLEKNAHKLPQITRQPRH